MDCEKDLLEKARANDQLAFNALFNVYWDFVYAFLLSRTSDPNRAEELSLETFSKAFDRISSFDQQRPFSNWLITIAKNHQIDQFRSTKKEGFTAPLSEDTIHEVSSEELSPEERLIASQNLDYVLGQIRSLKKEYRTILKLRYFDDLSLKQIEKELDESSSTVRVKLFRAKKMLANKLDRESI